MCKHIQSKGCVRNVFKANRKQNALITVQRNTQDSVPRTGMDYGQCIYM